MSKQVYKEMFENAVHVGHRTQKWNPLMKKFICAEQNGLHIINLEMTLELMNKALDYLKKSLSEGKTVLFVSTKPQSVKYIRDISKRLNMPYVDAKWIPGLLTNFETIQKRVKYLSNLKEQEANGDFDKYTKKEASKMKKELTKLQLSLGGVQEMKEKPDIVFVVDPVRDAIAVKEANTENLPIVAFVHTNADPTKISYPIPANDDAVKSLSYLFDKIKDAVI
jgi:small subunit ribosomal protein S2